MRAAEQAAESRREARRRSRREAAAARGESDSERCAFFLLILINHRGRGLQSSKNIVCSIGEK